MSTPFAIVTAASAGARVGFDPIMRGDGEVVSGWKNTLQSAIANVTPSGVRAEQPRRMAEPGFAEKAES